MCKVNKKWGDTRIDPCMRPLIKWLKKKEYKTLACCCGHGKYPMTIVVKSKVFNNGAWELLTETWIPRTKRFYKKDKQGYYYIPEVLK